MVMVGFCVDVFWVTGVGFCCECEVWSVSVFHSGSSITGVKREWKGFVWMGTICFMYVLGWFSGFRFFV